MILNLMPCVFPVLALKVTSFAELVHEDSRHKLMHGVAYTGGIVGSLLLLAMVVVGLRMFGTQVGWGFQFQNPVFPAVLAAAVVVFALNLFGVFEIGVQSNTIAQKTREASGLQRSVGEGILAVVLATPCSAPFLGTAVGFALTGSAFTILGIFAVLGLGLASPFVVLTMVPGLSDLLPRPGEWMVYLKKFLGFTLLGAGIWLVWIVGRSAGVDAMARLLGFLAVCGLAAWVYGQAQGNQSGVARAATIGAFVMLIPAGWWGLDIESGGGEAIQKASAAESGAIAWEPWSEERVQKELEEGRPVFVDFTADWCITCKVNERTVLSTERVVDTFERLDVATLKADWTDGDEDIRKKLQEFGKAGVPMYLVYRPEHPNNPQMLSEVISTGDVVSALE
jgi:thiol:disulfide interchange protein DsbD